MEREPHEKQSPRAFREILDEWRKEEERKLGGPNAVTIPEAVDEAVRNLEIIKQVEAASEQKGITNLVIPRQWENLLHHDMSWLSPGGNREKEKSNVPVGIIEGFLNKVKSRALD